MYRTTILEAVKGNQAIFTIVHNFYEKLIIIFFISRHLLWDLDDCFAVLFESETPVITLIDRTVDRERVTYSATTAEIAALFDICALSELGNTKNNLIAVRILIYIKCHY